jgi:predicted dehydrogenase
MTLKVALAGSGRWARSFTGPGLRDSGRTTLVGVWSPDRDHAQACARALGVRAHHSIGDLIECADAVAVVVDPRAQPEVATAAALAGRHVLLEKPIGTSTAAVLPLMDALRRNGTRAGFVSTYRWLPDVRVLRARGLLEVGTELRLTWRSDHFLGEAGSSWRHRDGALGDVGFHVLDLVCPLMGPVRWARGTATGSRLQVTLQHDCDRVSVLDVDCAADVRERSVEVWIADRAGLRQLMGPTAFRRPSNLATVVASDFAARCAGEPSSLPTVDEGLQLLRTVECVKRGLMMERTHD